MKKRGLLLGCFVLVAVLVVSGCAKQTPEELFVKGCKAFEGGDVIGAALYFNKFLENHAEHEYAGRAHLMLARTRARLGDEALAIKEYRVVTRKFPDSPEAVNASFELAEYYAMTQRPDEVEKELRALYQRSQDSRIQARALFEIAGAYISNATNPQKAESILREALLIAEDDEIKINAFFGMAEAYIRCATEPQKTEAILREALPLTTKTEERGEALFRMGHAYVACHDYEDAIRIYNEIIHDASVEQESKAMGYLFLAKSHKAEGDQVQALETLEQLRDTLGTTDVAIWSNVESALIVRETTPDQFDGYLSRAISAYQEIMDVSPTMDRAAWALTKIAEAHREVGDITSSIQTYGQIIEQHQDKEPYVDRSRQMIRILRQQLEASPETVPSATEG
ncbi:MAG TPA: tetratricopeptide repeat protein [bacterium]|nr:tetratricopeptide repeat protein [bacterium]